ncbi:MAG: transglycosylase domain-containing protein, partial [Nitriliruptorales bacterium]|nr:transglycosylase domain-containing protein [Nitriliruptorales bacterium]
MLLPRRSGRPGGASRGWVGLLAVALLASACGRVVDLEPGDPVEFVQQPQTSKVLAADGTVLAELHAEQDREDVAIDEVAEVAIQAVVSIEDRRFFLHRGVDAPAILRAAAVNVAEGSVEQGGSTLTQQYVKNTMTGPARTLERKLKEAALAFQLEQRYSKEEILERYLNTVYFGKGAYGIRAASQRFFGVEPAELDLAQAATLAGMIASPSRYDPFEHPEASRERRRLVLDAMVGAGQIDRDAAEEAAARQLELAPLDLDERVQAPYVVEEVKRLVQHDPQGVMAAIGVDVDERSERLFTGGLRVFTTLEPHLQDLADAAVTEVLEAEEALEDGPSAAVVVTDPTTGAIRAMVGGRDFFDPDDPQARFNLATQGRRQPGSAFKPVVLATALSRGITLDRRFPGGKCVSFERVAGWEDGVCNYGGTAYGSLNLREATVRSVNTVFARLAVELGPTALLEMAQTLGFRGLPQVHSLALGAGEVTPVAMAGAYGALADLGRYHEPYLIERIETADGEVLYEHDRRSYQALDASVAF